MLSQLQPYLVCTSGAMVYDLEKEETIYCAPIPNKVIDKVSEIAEKVMLW